MMRTATRFFIAIALTAAGATAANAQAAGAASPLPGTGDSTRISQGNQQNNAEYNHLISAGDDKPKKEDRAQTQAHQAPVPATAADIKGTEIGKIVSVDAGQAVVDTGKTKIGVPLIAFGKDDQGLLLAMTADKFNELIAKAQSH